MTGTFTTLGIDAAGQRTDFVYDAMGQQTETIEPTVTVYNSNGTTSQIRPTTTTTYDSLGRETSTIDPAGNLPGADPTQHMTTYSYDVLGQQTRVTYADGSHTDTVYDAVGNKLRQSMQYTGSEDPRWTDYSYDVAGNLIDVLQPAVADPQNGNTMTRPETKYAYDALGEETTQTDALGRVTMFSYDAYGRQDQRTLPAVSGQPTATEYTTYDNLGRMATQTDFDGNVTEYIYSDDSRVTGSEHNTLGRLVYKRYFASAADETAYYAGTTSDLGDFTHYAYDALGRQASTTDLSGTTSYTYDPITQQVASVTNSEGTINYTYDPATGYHTRTYTANTDTRYSYDQLGRLSTVSVYKLGGTDYTSAPLVTTYLYTADGTLGAELLPNGVQQDYNYDTLDRLTKEVIEKVASGTTTLMQTYTYGLQTDGNRTSDLEVTYSSTGTVSSADLIQWTYDALDRLTSETDDSVDTGTINNTTPTTTGLVYSDVYTMDLVGNRLTQVHTDADASKDETITSSYNSRDELTQEVSTLNGTTTNGYDANGSMIATDNSTTNQHVTYGYDLRNRLHAATSSGITTTYLYNDAGNKVGELSTSGNTYTLVDDNNPTGYSQVLEESSTLGGTPTRAYVIGNDIIAQSSTTGIEYLLKDGHGNTRNLVDGSAQVLQTYKFDGFGNAIGFDPSTAMTTHLFNAEAFDAVTGWYNQRARWYVTSDGRFSSADDQRYANNADPQTLNKYVYTSGNPVNFEDPSGHFEFTIAGTLVNITLREIVGLSLLVAVAGGYAASRDKVLFARAMAEFRGLIYSGEEAAIEAYNTVVSNSKVVTQAIDDPH